VVTGSKAPPGPHSVKSAVTPAGISPSTLSTNPSWLRTVTSRPSPRLVDPALGPGRAVGRFESEHHLEVGAHHRLHDRGPSAEDRRGGDVGLVAGPARVEVVGGLRRGWSDSCVPRSLPTPGPPSSPTSTPPATTIATRVEAATVAARRRRSSCRPSATRRTAWPARSAGRRRPSASRRTGCRTAGGDVAGRQRRTPRTPRRAGSVSRQQDGCRGWIRCHRSRSATTRSSGKVILRLAAPPWTATTGRSAYRSKQAAVSVLS
jgi:hypothetical protein